MTTDIDPPIVYATARGGQWIVHCPWCGSEHVHAPVPGPRVAHCTSGEHREYVVRLGVSAPEGEETTTRFGAFYALATAHGLIVGEDGKPGIEVPAAALRMLAELAGRAAEGSER